MAFSLTAARPRPSLRAAPARRRASARTPVTASSHAAHAATAVSRAFNFAAGPAILPLDVLEQAQKDLVSWQGCGMSVMEMSHRGAEFEGIIAKAEKDLRALMKIPDNYKVLFVQGGASTQFAALPLNFAPEGATVDYVVTGAWGVKAAEEAAKYNTVNIAATSKPNKFTDIPAQSTWQLTKGAAYTHICANETIGGVEFKSDPVVDGVLIADMSSNFISKPVDVSKYGVIYGGAQKNIGPSGVTIVIVREDLLGKARAITPTMLDYKIHADNTSLYNTPPCFSIYICGLVFERLLKLGGLEAVEKNNIAKANKIYDAIEASAGFYKCPVAANVRSLMNIPFTMATPELEKAFLKQADARGLIQLKGHRSVGGIRASVYNAMPMEGVDALAALMKEFHAANQ